MHGSNRDDMSADPARGPKLGSRRATPKYSADVPSWITTPDIVQTRTLNFHNGVPDEKTVQLLDDQIAFMRGVELS
jgi:hypothetical protein